jgi:hypothetical protein
LNEEINHYSLLAFQSIIIANNTKIDIANLYINYAIEIR